MKKVNFFPLTGENATPTLFRNGGLPIVVFVRSTWICPEIHYIRVYIMVGRTNANDDMRTDHSKNMARLDSILLSYRLAKEI